MSGRPDLPHGNPCWHDPDQVCAVCSSPPHRTDGMAFPHRVDARGLTPVRKCTTCHQWRTRDQWGEALTLRECAECEGTAISRRNRSR